MNHSYLQKCNCLKKCAYKTCTKYVVIGILYNIANKIIVISTFKPIQFDTSTPDFVKVLRKRVNSYFGYELINDIKLLNINLNNKKKNVKNSIKFSKKLNEKIDMIKNKEIKKSLSNLLKAINND